MNYQHLHIGLENGIGRVTLNRPEVRNAFNEVMIGELTHAFRTLDADARARVLVLAGEGPAFCAGADLNWMKKMAGYSDEENRADAMGLATMLNSLHRTRKPTIARVHGPAYAGGMGLVSACDIAVAADTAEFCLSEVKLGLTAATISPYVVAAIGERCARRYFLTAERFGAGEALRIGLVHAAVPAAELDARIAEIAQQLLAASPAAIAASKDLIRRVAHGEIDADMIADTASRIAAARASADGKEGVRAFLEKRKPAWN